MLSKARTTYSLAWQPLSPLAPLTSTKDWQLGSVRARFGAHRRKTG
jgi:hypothetical protein